MLKLRFHGLYGNYKGYMVIHVNKIQNDALKCTNMEHNYLIRLKMLILGVK